jgi:hypothetical protein
MIESIYICALPIPAQDVIYRISLGDYSDDGGGGGIPGWPF